METQRAQPMEAPLLAAIPPRSADDRAPSADAILDAFLGYVTDKGLSLYPAQEEAILELLAGKNVILNTPTGSGKSLVATAVHFQAIARGERTFYTSPIKALDSEKFFDLCRELGAENVGMMTGDATVNRDAKVVCCTAEILSSIALTEGGKADIDHVVMDEFHYYGDRDRGVAWQVPLLTLPQARFLLMSATLGKMDFFVEELTRRTGRETALVASTTRPVPLDFSYAETPLHETIAKLIATGRAPVYLVNFTQRACAEVAQSLLSTDFASKDHKKAITAAMVGARFPSPYGREVQKLLRHGVGIHHAGLLPRYRLLVEKLAQAGMLHVICGTDTLGVGVNVPIRTVLFTQLCKFDGEKSAILSARDFHQISGRAGRKGFDDVGYVVAQAPEHVIENLKLEAKAGDDPSKKRKIVKRKPPERGYVHWDRNTLDRLIAAPPEPLQSRFAISHAMLLSVLDRDDGCRALKSLVRDCHETPASKRAIRKKGFVDLRALLEVGVVRFAERSDGRGKRVVVADDLQRDFSIHHALAFYLLDVVERLDRASPTYALDVLTLCESIVDDPEVILRKQVDIAKTRKMAEMKAAGVEYDERIAELEKITYPKPNAALIYATFDEFARVHPWVAHQNIRPKSIAREMIESFLSFDEYIKEYDLQRSEGTLLRYLSEVTRVVEQTVPPATRDEAFDDLAAQLRAIVRGVDDSLIEEWQRIRDAAEGAPIVAIVEGEAAPIVHDFTADRRAFVAGVRNETFRFVRALAAKDYALAASIVADETSDWTVEKLTDAMRAFWSEHSTLRIDAGARAPAALRWTVSEDADRWSLEQTIFDGEGDDDWVARFTLSIARCREQRRVALGLIELTAG
jgi:superfamily II RNA helicase